RLIDVHSLGEQISLERLLTIFYKRLIRKIIEDLNEFSQRVITVRLLEKLFGGEALNRRKRIDKSLDGLQRLLDEGVIDEKIKSYVRKIEGERGSSSKISGGFELSGQVSNSDAHGKGKLNFGLHSDVAWKSKKKLETVYNGLAVLDYDKIRSHI